MNYLLEAKEYSRKKVQAAEMNIYHLVMAPKVSELGSELENH